MNEKLMDALAETQCFTCCEPLPGTARGIVCLTLFHKFCDGACRDEQCSVSACSNRQALAVFRNSKAKFCPECTRLIPIFAKLSANKVYMDQDLPGFEMFHAGYRAARKG